MTIVVAGLDVSKTSLNIHLNGKDDTATNDTNGFRKIARILGTAGRGRRTCTDQPSRSVLSISTPSPSRARGGAITSAR